MKKLIKITFPVCALLLTISSYSQFQTDPCNDFGINKCDDDVRDAPIHNYIGVGLIVGICIGGLFHFKKEKEEKNPQSSI